MFTYGIPLDLWLFQGLEGYRMVLQELVVLVVFIEELLNSELCFKVQIVDGVLRITGRFGIST